MQSSVGQLKKTHIVITKCLAEKCSGFYTDTISESVLIECNDPIHHDQGQNKNGEKEEGNQPHCPPHHRIQETGSQPDHTRIVNEVQIQNMTDNIRNVPNFKVLLKESIKVHGLCYAIVANKDNVSLDERHHFKACEELNIEPNVKGNFGYYARTGLFIFDTEGEL